MTDENNMDVPSEDLTPEKSGPPSEAVDNPESDAADAPKSDAADAPKSDAADAPKSDAADAPKSEAAGESGVGPDLSASLLEDADPVAVDSKEKAEPAYEKPSPGADDVPEEDAEEAMLQMLDGLPDDEDKATADDINFGASASKAEFQHLQQPAASPEVQNIELLMDVDLPVSIELGRTKMNISSILALGPGSVVELNKLAGEPVDLLVNYKVVAKGEVVVVDESFGLRITQLMTPEERLKALAQE